MQSKVNANQNASVLKDVSETNLLVASSVSGPGYILVDKTTKASSFWLASTKPSEGAGLKYGQFYLTHVEDLAPKAETDEAMGLRSGATSLEAAEDFSWIKTGAKVFWNDPDDGVSSGPGVVTSIQGQDCWDEEDDGPFEVMDDAVISIALDDGGEVEALRHEIRPLEV